MLNLTYKNFQKAQDYVFTHADNITRAWFSYNFEDSNTDTFMSALAEYHIRTVDLAEYFMSSIIKAHA